MNTAREEGGVPEGVAASSPPPSPPLSASASADGLWAHHPTPLPPLSLMVRLKMFGEKWLWTGPPPPPPPPKRKHRASTPPPTAEAVQAAEQRRVDAELRAKHAEAALGVEAVECARKLKVKEEELTIVKNAMRKRSAEVTKLQAIVIDMQEKEDKLNQTIAENSVAYEKVVKEAKISDRATRRLTERLKTFDAQVANAQSSKHKVSGLKMLVAAATARADAAESEQAQAEEAQAEMEAHTAQKTRNHTFLEMKADSRDELARSVGLPPGKYTVPSQRFEGIETDEAKAVWEQRSKHHMITVLKGRPADLVAKSLVSAGLADEVMATKPFETYHRATAAAVIAKVEEHWSARMSVHIWDRLDLSRRGMEKLRHLLSFIFNPVLNMYIPLAVWISKWRLPSVFGPTLVSRQKREAEFSRLTANAEIVVDAMGSCQRDTVRVTEAMYNNFTAAMRSDYSEARPAQPVLYLDATGASLGRGFTHVEMGSADFAGDCKQSRATMGPLAAWTGSDKAIPIRENCTKVLPGFNSMIHSGTLHVGEKEVPCRPLTAADMQGTKALYGMSAASHAVWCKCRKGKGQHDYPKDAVTTKEEMLAAINAVGCKMKTEEEMCEWAHYSFGIHRGRAFTPVHCRLCGYKAATETKWRADVLAWEKMSDEERKAATDMHNGAASDEVRCQECCPEGEEEDADADEAWGCNKHYHQLLFVPPGVHHGMDKAGVDLLHLVDLNFFKHLFAQTIHNKLQPKKKKLVKEYLRLAGFYSYDAAAAEEESPVMRWIGREVKRFLQTADLHLPFLLRIASCPAELTDEIAEELEIDDDGNIGLDEDDEELQPTEEELAAEEELLPDMMQCAEYWDNFLALVENIQAPWTEDTDEYRETRAIAAFNHACVCCVL